MNHISIFFNKLKKNMSYQRQKKFKTMMIAIICIVTFSSVGYTAMESDGHITAQESSGGELLFLGKKLQINEPLYYVAGRIFLPMNEFIRSLGGTVARQQKTVDITWKNKTIQLNGMKDEKLVWPLYLFDKVSYISLYDAAELLNLSVVFDAKQNQINFYHKKVQTVSQQNTEDRKPGFLRLEDIYFDNGISGNFSDETNEKLRVVSDYLYSRGQTFYIAWIPLYKYPEQGIENDLTQNFSFYNADFLYTLDYMTQHNGHIVLHGYTHQENDTQSGVGSEFGPKSPFNSKQVEQRMQKSKQIANSLGFEDNIFEFPHYTFTEEQMRIAERNFDVIYQQYNKAKTVGRMDKIVKNGREVTFVSTPLGYIPSFEELPSVLEKVDTLPEDQLRSIFFHPFMDFKKIHLDVNQLGERVYTYDKDAALVQLVDKITSSGYIFSPIE